MRRNDSVWRPYWRHDDVVPSAVTVRLRPHLANSVRSRSVVKKSCHPLEPDVGRSEVNRAVAGLGFWHHTGRMMLPFPHPFCSRPPFALVTSLSAPLMWGFGDLSQIFLPTYDAIMLYTCPVRVKNKSMTIGILKKLGLLVLEQTELCHTDNSHTMLSSVLTEVQPRRHLSAAIIKCRRRSQIIIENNVKPSCLSEKLISNHAH